ncbi:MAG: hypothetical protein B7Z59_11230 [Acidiphilium sp. 37-67-22]|nr:MAG: hypothetical protein B7Z59_11230 [Acidiphilium sp. 37-67-22]HQT73915.1 DUF1178 family protein [Acidiphilium sp.]
MIHYQLRCGCGHEFDGWFASSESFDRQAKRRLLNCPRCGGDDVDRALMAPRIAKAVVAETAPAQPPAKATQSTAVAGRMPDELRATLASLRREVEARCDFVGDEFAAEARRIHHGEAPARGIYGAATEAESEALADEGIAFAKIPWVPLADS